MVSASWQHPPCQFLEQRSPEPFFIGPPKFAENRPHKDFDIRRLRVRLLESQIPMSSAPKAAGAATCAHGLCGKKLQPPVLCCSKCKWATYCCKACQVERVLPLCARPVLVLCTACAFAFSRPQSWGRREGPVSTSGRMGLRARARAIGIPSGAEEGLGVGPGTLDRELEPGVTPCHLKRRAVSRCESTA